MSKNYYLKLRLREDSNLGSIQVGPNIINKNVGCYKFRKANQLVSVKQAVDEGAVIDVEDFFGNNAIEEEVDIAEFEEAVETIKVKTAPVVEEPVVEAPVVEEPVVEEPAPEEEVVEEEEKEKEDDRFYCPVEGCPKHEEGYSRAGDLTRHMNKEHPEV